MRIFIALEPPEMFASDTAELARQLSGMIEGRFPPRENHHLTLAFIGETDEAGVAAAIEAMDAACKGVGPVPVRSDGLGKFGRASDATLWLGIAPRPKLMELAAKLRAELAARSIRFDPKPFKPHVTLARRACIPKVGLPALAFPRDDEARTITLLKSALDHEGATYKPLHSIDLVANGSYAE